MDVDGNDNQPEWGYCTAPNCKEAAHPIWLSGAYPDDADLLRCEAHIGAHIAALQAQLAACLLANDEVALLNADYLIALQRIAATRGECVGAELRAIAKDALAGIAPDPPF